MRRCVSWRFIALGAATLALTSCAFVARVDVASDGTSPAHAESSGYLSGDGRFDAFLAFTPLVAGDTNGEGDVYLRDVRDHTTERVSVSTTGGDPDGRSGPMGISADGRYVLFFSWATNLVPGGTTGTNLFVPRPHRRHHDARDRDHRRPGAGRSSPEPAPERGRRRRDVRLPGHEPRARLGREPRGGVRARPRGGDHRAGQCEQLRRGGERRQLCRRCERRREPRGLRIHRDEPSRRGAADVLQPRVRPQSIGGHDRAGECAAEREHQRRRAPGRQRDHDQRPVRPVRILGRQPHGRRSGRHHRRVRPRPADPNHHARDVARGHSGQR